MLFTKVEGEQAIVIQNGIYRQCDIYERLGALYARIGNGYIRLYGSGTTSAPKVRLETLAYDGPLFTDKLGRLTTKNGSGHKAISVSSEGALLLEHK